MVTRTMVTAATALLVALGSAACSSSSGGTTNGATNDATNGTSTAVGSSVGRTSPAAAADAAPIRVGAICSCSGPLGSSQVPEQDVYKAWVNTVNAAGGINGHHIDLITKDDGSNPGNAVTAAQSLISSHVVAIVDMSVLDTAWEQTAHDANIPVVGVGIPNSPFYKDPDFYPEGQTGDTSALAVASVAKAAGATNIGVVYCAEAPVCQELVPAMKHDGQKVGLSVPFSTSVSATAPNYTAQCVAAKQAGITALAVFAEQAAILRLGHDCAAQDFYPIYVTEGAAFGPKLIGAPGITNIWSEYADLPFWSNTPTVQTMNAAVDKYYPNLRSDKDTWYEDAAMAWPSGILLEHAIKAGGLTPNEEPSAAEVTKGLNLTHADTLNGWSPPLTFQAGKTHSVTCWFIGSVTNGKTALANNGKPTCENNIP